MKSKVQLIVINSVQKSYEGRQYMQHQAQMIMTHEREINGVMQPETFVCRKNLPDELKDTAPGEYTVELVPYADKNGMLDFRVVGFVPLRQSSLPLDKKAS